MGLDYSFEFAVEVGKVEGLYRAVARRLRGADRERLLACLPFEAGDPLRGLRSEEFKGEVDSCVGFLIAAEAEVVEERGSALVMEEGKVVVGCVYLDVWVGEAVVVLSAVAATRSMSGLFERPVVVEMMREIARDAGVIVVMFEDWMYDGRCVWPVEARLGYVSEEGDKPWLEWGRRARDLRRGGPQ